MLLIPLLLSGNCWNNFFPLFLWWGNLFENIFFSLYASKINAHYCVNICIYTYILLLGLLYILSSGHFFSPANGRTKGVRSWAFGNFENRTINDLFTNARPSAELAYDSVLIKDEFIKRIDRSLYDYDARHPGNSLFVIEVVIVLVVLVVEKE